MAKTAKTTNRKNAAAGGESGLISKLTTAALLGAVAGVVWGSADRRRRSATETEPTSKLAGLSEPVSEPPNNVVRRLDHYQRERPWLGFPLGVVKKFGEDRAGYLASLVAYFGFFSIFPLMLAFTSVLGFILTDPQEQQEFSDAAADQIPVIGDTIRDTAGQLEGSVIAIIVGLAVALWSGRRIMDAMQNALKRYGACPGLLAPNWWNAGSRVC